MRAKLNSLKAVNTQFGWLHPKNTTATLKSGGGSIQGGLFIQRTETLRLQEGWMETLLIKLCCIYQDDEDEDETRMDVSAGPWSQTQPMETVSEKSSKAAGTAQPITWAGSVGRIHAAFGIYRLFVWWSKSWAMMGLVSPNRSCHQLSSPTFV